MCKKRGWYGIGCKKGGLISMEIYNLCICCLTEMNLHEVKNNCCLFERLLKVKKNGVFLYGISFFVLEILTFLYYANEGSDDIINSSTKTTKY